MKLPSALPLALISALLLLGACKLNVVTPPTESSSTPTTGSSASPGSTAIGNIKLEVGSVAASAAVLSLDRNMARLTGVTIETSSDYAGWPKSRLNDGKLETSWFTAAGDAANKGTKPFIVMNFPEPVSVKAINLRGNREYKGGYDILEGRLTLHTSAGDGSFNVVLPQPDRDFSLRFASSIAGVTSIRFDITKDESVDPGLSELEVDGSK
ncbi:MAG TPA: hypothetical protein V6D23_00005 [Candidatus Obscuribacterales bacterium]